MKIIAGKRLSEDVVYQQQLQLPISSPIVQYVRQSTMGQVKNHIQSKIQQDQLLRRRLVAMGWKEEDIRLIDKDQGVSGQKRQDEREGLAELVRLIESGEVGAVAAYDASRLWRDRTQVYSNMFVELCATHKIPVIFFDQIFRPEIQRDRDALSEAFREASYQLRQVYDKMLPAKKLALEMGQTYVGHGTPMGYIVVGDKGEKHYEVYEPHAEIIRSMFKRYRELGG